MTQSYSDCKIAFFAKTGYNTINPMNLRFFQMFQLGWNARLDWEQEFKEEQLEMDLDGMFEEYLEGKEKL